MSIPENRSRLVGGIHRNVTGQVDEPTTFFLSVDRRLKSGKLDDVPLDEDQILKLVAEGAEALRLFRGSR